MEIYLHNTLSGKKELFKPIQPGVVLMYNCGPTVYNYAHIGNLRSYIFADTLRRMFEYNGYEVKQVINITDVGHLVNENEDSGEDKMTKALKREGKPMTLSAMREVADFYFDAFKKDLVELNIEMPDKFPFASDHIQEDIDMVQVLSNKGFTYATSDGIYFDISKFSAYGKLGNINVSNTGESRIGINEEKRNARDFAVWKFNSELGYDAPFGKGFPGWHIECSAMSVKYLGPEFDVHTGGIDHIPVHHNNEIAQAVCSGNPYARYWMHNAFYNTGNERIAKSGDGSLTLHTVKGKNIDPLALRYVFLSARYSSPIQYSEETLSGAHTAVKKLRVFVQSNENDKVGLLNTTEYKNKFLQYVNDDLDTPKALALVWDLINDDSINTQTKRDAIVDFDRVLGLNLTKTDETELPLYVRELIIGREIARKNKNFAKSDEIRAQIENLGFEVEDKSTETVVRPK